VTSRDIRLGFFSDFNTVGCGIGPSRNGRKCIFRFLRVAKIFQENEWVQIRFFAVLITGVTAINIKAGSRGGTYLLKDDQIAQSSLDARPRTRYRSGTVLLQTSSPISKVKYERWCGGRRCRQIIAIVKNAIAPSRRREAGDGNQTSRGSRCLPPKSPRPTQLKIVPWSLVAIRLNTNKISTFLAAVMHTQRKRQ
jgi:hypothetical protein